MKKFKIFSRRGKPTWKEKKLLADLEPILERKLVTDSNFAANFRPVSSLEDLQRLHSIYCTENAQIISETPNNTTMQKDNETMLSNEKEINLNETRTKLEETETKSSFSDPFNEEEPIIRDYVLKGDEYSKQPINNQFDNNIVFNEPTNFDDAFSIPDIDDNTSHTSGTTNTSNSGGNNGGNNGGNKTEAPKNNPKPQPVNPYFDDQSNQNKKKQTKRFAKYITGFVCFALEKGYVWFTTKDINEAKMIEYELKGDFDVSLMVTLDSETRVTAKEFFRKMCTDAIVASKISQDDQDELSDALADVLMEKGIAPTPMQTLLMVSGQILAKQVTNAFMSISISKSVIAGLKEYKNSQETEEKEALESLMNEAESSKKATNEPIAKEDKDEDLDYVVAEEV
jgi:hypothetical protein